MVPATPEMRTPPSFNQDTMHGPSYIEVHKTTTEMKTPSLLRIPPWRLSMLPLAKEVGGNLNLADWPQPPLNLVDSTGGTQRAMS